MQRGQRCKGLGCWGPLFLGPKRVLAEEEVLSTGRAGEGRPNKDRSDSAPQDSLPPLALILALPAHAFIQDADVLFAMDFLHSF